MAPSISTREAAERAGLTLHGLRKWFDRHDGLGVKVGGRWRVNEVVLTRILNGESSTSRQRVDDHDDDTDQDQLPLPLL